MKSLSKMIMVLAVVGLGGFTIVNSVRGTSDIPVLTEEFVPVTENNYVNTSTIRYVNRSTHNNPLMSVML